MSLCFRVTRELGPASRRGLPSVGGEDRQRDIDRCLSTELYDWAVSPFDGDQHLAGMELKELQRPLAAERT
jgi:hypothetical protein